LHKLIPKDFRLGYPQIFAPRVEVPAEPAQERSTPEAQVATREPRPTRNNAKKVRFQENGNE